MIFRIGDKVKIKGNDDRIFIIYGKYDDDNVSLGLYDYPDVEQDYLYNIKELIKVEK